MLTNDRHVVNMPTNGQGKPLLRTQVQAIAAAWLTREMKGRGFNQKALAEKSGISRQVIGEICDQSGNLPRDDTFAKLAAALGAEVPLIGPLDEAGRSAYELGYRNAKLDMERLLERLSPTSEPSDREIVDDDVIPPPDGALGDQRA
jgi:transcriptional regulator with XRE-family HTH domain